MGGARVDHEIREQPEVVDKVLGARGLDDARRLVEDARLVRLCGIGSSRNAAGFGAWALERFAGRPAIVEPPPEGTSSPPALGLDQVAIILSQSGETPATIQRAEAVRSAGTPIVAITNAPGSPLHELADVAVLCDAGPERVVAATKSVTAQMALLRAVAEPFDTRPLVAALRMACEHPVETVVRRPPPEAVVCSGFAAEWVAREIALKFAEMAGLPVAAHSLVEHLHGPVAANPRTIHFVEPTDPNASSRGPDAVHIGPSPWCDLETPGLPDASLTAILTVVVGQRLAFGWARRLCEDPDDPRGLQKVTRTR